MITDIITEDHARVIAALARLDAVGDETSAKMLGDTAQEARMGMERTRRLLHELTRPVGGLEPFVRTTTPGHRRARRYYLRQRLEDLVDPGEQRRLGL